MSDAINPGNATVGFDLSKYHAPGGKLLSYHGMSDPLIPTGSTPYYYNHVLRTLAPGGIDIDEFYKFFLVPGMGHCSGSLPGAPNALWYFAGPNQQPVIGNTVYITPGFEDKEHDVILSMMAWVEEGTVPEYVIGTKCANHSASNEVTRQRPLCMYPKQAKYTGKGDVDNVENWECQELY